MTTTDAFVSIPLRWSSDIKINTNESGELVLHIGNFMSMKVELRFEDSPGLLAKIQRAFEQAMKEAEKGRVKPKRTIRVKRTVK